MLRFDLEPAQIESLSEEAHTVAAPGDVIEDVSAQQLAVAVLAELSARQADILRLQLSNASVRAIADEIHASHWDRLHRAKPHRCCAFPCSATRIVKAAVTC